MSAALTIDCSNTIVYCSRWRECVAFYRHGIGLEVVFENDWFVEFALNSTSRLSVADARRASIESADGRGITLTFKVRNITVAHRVLRERGLSPGKVEKHAWCAEVFYLRDPDGNRIEFWSG
ncbi:MAG TPA: VOC family protein [Gammaproteobacteria bacterium]|nr:VOC family protein [Gammaproteobacteria bacterium]